MTLDLTEWIYDEFADLSDKARNTVSICAVDFFAAALAALEEPAYRHLIAYIKDTSKGSIPLPGMQETTNAQQAAMALGTLGHALDYDDISSVLIGHPSVVLMPVIYALGYEQNSSGKQMMDAYTAGYETMAQIAANSAGAQYVKGWHTTATIGVFGATAAACRLLSLNRSDAMHAMGLAASLASGIRGNFGTSTKPLHAGWAAGNGIFAAKLAAKGFDASLQALNSQQSYFHIFSGTNKVHRVSKRFIEEGIIIKPYPSCGYTTRAIDCAIKIREIDDFHADSIKSVTCFISPSTDKVLCYPDPQDGMQAKFSLEYCTALGLLTGPMNNWHFAGGFAESKAAAQELMSKISREIVENLRNASYGEQVLGLKIEMQNGQQFEAAVKSAKGYPENPMSEEDLKEKFMGCMNPRWDRQSRLALYEQSRGFFSTAQAVPLIDKMLSCLP